MERAITMVTLAWAPWHGYSGMAVVVLAPPLLEAPCDGVAINLLICRSGFGGRSTLGRSGPVKAHVESTL